MKKQIAIYKAALKKLENASYSKKMVWLHDYDDIHEIKPDHEARRFGCYIDSIVDDVTGKRILGNRSFYEAKFINKTLKSWEKSNYANNSRCIPVKFALIEKRIKDGIRQKIKDVISEEKRRLNNIVIIQSLDQWKTFDKNLRSEIIKWAHLANSKDQLTPIMKDRKQYGKIKSTGDDNKDISAGPGYKNVGKLSGLAKTFAKSMVSHFLESCDTQVDDSSGLVVDVGKLDVHVQVYSLPTGEFIGGSVFVVQSGYLKENGPDFEESWQANGYYDYDLSPLKIDSRLEHSGY